MLSVDVNSSYPKSMTKNMCLIYKETKIYDNYVVRKDFLIKHNLYYAKFEYIGNDKYIIPNLMFKNDKN